MTCSRDDCGDARPHVHLPWRDELAITNVLIRACFERDARRAAREARADRHDHSCRPVEEGKNDHGK